MKNYNKYLNNILLYINIIDNSNILYINIKNLKLKYKH